MRGHSDYALHGDESGHRRINWAALLIIVLVSALSAWRASLPTNQHRELDVYYQGKGDAWSSQRRMFNGFDDVATVVQAYHFARDGFWRTRLLPNRAGAPLVSLFDATQTQCKTLDRQPTVPRYRNLLRQWVPMISLDRDGDCIYAHYPPLADWIFGAMAALGYERILHYRLLAITVSAASLWLLFLWLRGEVSERAAAVTLALVATLPAYYQWASALHYVPFQYLFLFGGILTWSKYQRRPRRCWFLLTWLQFFAEAMVSHELTLCFGIILCGLELLEVKGARRFRPKLLLIQASAPMFALLLHFGQKM